MDTRLKKYSHSIITKIIVFLLVVTCFTGLIKTIVDVEVVHDGEFSSAFQDNYFQSHSYVKESGYLAEDLTRLVGFYKSEEHILNGGTVDEDELKRREQELFYDFQSNSKSYNPNLTEAENFEKFKTEYADKIAQVRDELIRNDLRDFHSLLQRVEEVKNPFYYASDGVNVYKNSSNTAKEQFKSFPSYLILEDYKNELYPKEAEENENLHQAIQSKEDWDPKGQVVYVAYSKEFLQTKIQDWKETKRIATASFYKLLAYLTGFILSFLYLVFVTGRKSFKDEELHLHSIDKLFVELNILICMGLMALWVALLDNFASSNIPKLVIPITIPISAAVLLFILSLIRHIKNRTIFKHTLIYQIIYRLIQFVKHVYGSGSVAVKTVLIVIGYPVLVALTFFMFPITIGFAAWFALKKVKAFQAIKEGVAKIKEGDIHHRIYVGEKGEFAGLAENINSITDGLNSAVESELKSERLKTELITNVSHDIRTPLTAIITYVDLLKQEKDPVKTEKYLEVLDQKSKRLKTLTDDLFEAAKASSGNIPVQLGRVDIVSLVTQGLGEVSDKIEASGLDFKINYPDEKLYVLADGKLLWRSIENVLSNTFKYALPGSRVYIQFEDAGNVILLTFKNMSAYELNISADELMERFKRGDESRTSQGSGLGLSIAQSLIENQGGKFAIQIDGDLFKSMIYMPKDQ
ncbi:HAMP domain-containing sensor histidine kinase [Neobacillus sp. 114]|uniref:HAMP domain-containing sensor histidine kinase n=1 Tax=Neobacillus sp. 114 TaxID=3048535 RepID=UPI0020B25154|nr:HAMP domain-containing sensor histidine kinase [Neobacillus sp. 114]